MDSFRIRALWLVDTDTGTICAERRYAALERSHAFHQPMTTLPSNSIVAAVLDTIGAKVKALEVCGSTHNGAITTSHHLLGAMASPQSLDVVQVPVAGARGRLGGRLAGKGMGTARVNTSTSSSNHIMGNATAASPSDSVTEKSPSSSPMMNAPLASRLSAATVVPIGPFVAFSARRGVRIEVTEDRLIQIGEGPIDEEGQPDGGVLQRALIDDVLTSFETHPQYAPAENLVIIAAPLVTTTAASGAVAATAGSIALRHLLATCTTSLQALLCPLLDDTLVVGMEGAVMTSEVEVGMAAVNDFMAGWDHLCARRVVSDLTWRRAVEALLTAGLAMGRMLSVVSEGPSRHNLPCYAAASPSSYRFGSGCSAKKCGRVRVTVGGGGSPLAGNAHTAAAKSLQAQSLLNAFDATNEDDDASGGMVAHRRAANGVEGSANRVAAMMAIGDADDDGAHRTHNGAGGSGAGVLASLELGPNPTPRDIDNALNAAATYQTTLFMEQHVAAQYFGNAANATVAVATHVMMAPPLRHSTRFSNRVATSASLNTTNNNDNVLCLVGGAPPPHAAYWSTALNRTGPTTSMTAMAMMGAGSSAGANIPAPPSHASAPPSATSDVYISRDRALVTSVVGAPEPLPMTIPMTPSLILDKKRLADEGLTTAGAAHAVGLSRFILNGAWRLPPLNPSIPSTSSTNHLNNKYLGVSASASYPPITTIALAADFAESTKARRDVGIPSNASMGAGGVVGGSGVSGMSSALLTVGGGGGNSANGGTTAARFTTLMGGPNGVHTASSSAANGTGAALHQRPQSILTMVHEVPRALNSNTHSPASGPSPQSTTAMKAGGMVGNYAFLPILDYDRARRIIHTTDFGQGVGMDAPNPSLVHGRTKEELLLCKEYVETLLEHQGHVLYRLDLEVTVDLGGVPTADIPKLDVVFGVTDHSSILYYHLNIAREESEISPAGNTTPSGTKLAYANVTSQQLSDAEVLVSFTNGAGVRVRNGTTFSIKGIVVCDVSERPTSSALPSFSIHAAKPAVAPNEADILSAVTIYSSASLHFTMLVERPFLPGSCVLADPVVMGKCLVDGAMGDTAKAGTSTTSAVTSSAAFGGGGDQSSPAALMASTLDQLQKKIRAVAFSSKGTGSLVERQLRSPVRLGLPLTPFPADGDSPLTWRRSDLSSPAPVTAAVIVRSHPEKGFMLWNYGGDV